MSSVPKLLPQGGSVLPQSLGKRLWGRVKEGLQHSEQDRRARTLDSQCPRLSDPQERSSIQTNLIKQEQNSGVGLSSS